MNSRWLMALAIGSAAGLSGCSWTGSWLHDDGDQVIERPVMSPAARYQSVDDRVDAAKWRTRAALIRQAASAYGVRAGFSTRAAEIQAVVHSHAEQLDRVYTFLHLLIDGRMLPPVVESVQHVQALSDNARQMRETSKVYRVVEQARLVTAPPTWRSWLTLAPKPVQRPEDRALPQNDREQAVWDEAVASAWKIGVAQANAVARSQIEKLTYDYQGMLRYRRLVAKGILDPSVVSHAGKGVVVGANTLRLQDRIYSVSEDARFNSVDDWRVESAVITPDLSGPVNRGGAND